MSEIGKQIIETIATAVTNMSDFDKGYILGMGEAIVNGKKSQEAKKATEADKDTKKCGE